MPLELLSIVAPIYVVIGLGFGWARLGRRYDNELITELIMTFGAPCLIFSSLVGMELPGAAVARLAGAAACAVLVFAVTAAALLRMAGLPLHTFLAPMTFPNVGNMGLPVCLFAFGPKGLALGIGFFTVTAISQYTVGLWLWSGRVSFAQLARTPLAWAAAIAVAVLAFDWPVPGWIRNTTGLLGGFTIPLMQFSLGVSLGRLSHRFGSRIAWLSALRLGMGLVVGWGLATLFGFTGVERGVLILDCSMPVAVLNYLLADRYARSPHEVAGVVVLSTTISLVTLPLVLAWVI